MSKFLHVLGMTYCCRCYSDVEINAGLLQKALLVSRLGFLFLLVLAILHMLLMYVINSKRERTHPCHVLDEIWNLFESHTIVLTAHWLLM